MLSRDEGAVIFGRERVRGSRIILVRGDEDGEERDDERDGDELRVESGVADPDEVDGVVILSIRETRSNM
jgi:hypothetical protein